jgi:hypothetical protein
MGDNQSLVFLLVRPLHDQLFPENDLATYHVLHETTIRTIPFQCHCMRDLKSQ